MAIATPLSVSGRYITVVNGNLVKLARVNWAGAHQDAMTPGGLDYQQRAAIAAQIAEWGFNHAGQKFWANARATPARIIQAHAE